MDVSRYGFLCQKALHQGLQYARSFGNPALEVEHIALALLRAESIELGKGLSQRVQTALRQYLGREQKVFGNVEIQFGKRLDLALDEAEGIAKNELIEEDLLWRCLVKQSTILQNLLSLDIEKKEGSDAKPKGEGKQPAPPFKPQQAAKREAKENEGTESYRIDEKLDKVLKDFCLDLSSLAERGELDPVIGRDVETRRVLEILGRKKKNNPILIGEAGVGKTAVAELLALKIAEGKVPSTMKGKRVLSLDLAALIAGAKFRGEFEERMKNLLKAIKACEGEIILFIDEIHTLVGAGSADGSTDAANLLKPALARGELRCLGATTFDEYRKYIEKDPALERRFQAVKVEEPTRETALSILRGLKASYQVFHGVQIHDEALVSAVDLSMRFLPQRRLPDKAIDLLDEACSKLRLQIDSEPKAMDELRGEIDRMELEKKALANDQTAKSASVKLDIDLKQAKKRYDEYKGIWEEHKKILETLRKNEAQLQELRTLFENTLAKGEFDFAAKLQYDEIPKLDKNIQEVRAKLTESQAKYSWLRQIVGTIEIAEVISAWSQIPVGSILKEESKDLLECEARLNTKVFGQETATKILAKAVMRARVGINDPNRPLGVFLFVGPTGVGKTEAAKALAQELFDDPKRMVRIDMSEYMEQHAVARLIGSPPGYVGYGEGGELTEPVRRTPYTVVLLDEIEKAHPRVLDILLQTFDDGRLTDSQARTVSFRNTLIIMTSNLAVPYILGAEGELDDESIRTELTKTLRPEFVGRIDEVVAFSPLGFRHFEFLFARLLRELNERLSSRQFQVVIGKNLTQKIMTQVVHSHFGGRGLRRIFEQEIANRVSERILTHMEECKGVWNLEWQEATNTYHWQVDSSLHRYLPPAS